MAPEVCEGAWPVCEGGRGRGQVFHCVNNTSLTNSLTPDSVFEDVSRRLASANKGETIILQKSHQSLLEGLVRVDGILNPSLTRK